MELPNIDNSWVTVQSQMEPQLTTCDGFSFVCEVTHSLVIANVNDSDSGVYTCVADNGVANADTGIVEVFVRCVLI